EIIGTPSNVPWAFIFTRVDVIPRHPSQLYEGLFYFIVTIALYLVWKSRRFSVAHGFIFGLGMALIFTQRFLIVFLKENQVPFEEALTLNMGQMLSLPLIVIGVVVMVWSRRGRYDI
ncbi:MAG TPA: prolipoprotein diacylglyceryl transferase, partial [Cyclobacteriaceae bacterium]|nr:prolipoprotein diacylglyceryl transferase [Cyclobacteriaceae bacterium]